MDIRTYLSRADEDAAARDLHVSVHTIRKWRTGDRVPSRDNALALIEWSHGVLSLNDIYQPDERAA